MDALGGGRGERRGGFLTVGTAEVKGVTLV